jgi:hypothetical protein
MIFYLHKNQSVQKYITALGDHIKMHAARHYLDKFIKI